MFRLSYDTALAVTRHITRRKVRRHSYRFCITLGLLSISHMVLVAATWQMLSL